MVENINALQEYVRRIVTEKESNYRKVARNLRGLISHSTVSDVINGRNTNPSPRVLRGLAKGLGVTEEEIFAVVRGKVPDEKTVIEEGLYRNLRRLSPANRKIAEKQIAGIIEALAATEPDFNYIEEDESLTD